MRLSAILCVHPPPPTRSMLFCPGVKACLAGGRPLSPGLWPPHSPASPRQRTIRLAILRRYRTDRE